MSKRIVKPPAKEISEKKAEAIRKAVEKSVAEKNTQIENRKGKGQREKA